MMWAKNSPVFRLKVIFLIPKGQFKKKTSSVFPKPNAVQAAASLM
jgi:hypothetical protein